MALIVAGLIVSIPAAGQTPAKKWRTPWGDPDLQGSWSNSTTTPLERPAKYAGREFMTAAELAERRQRRRPTPSGMTPVKRRAGSLGLKADRPTAEHRSFTIHRMGKYLH
jgi:hypothetical protein